MIGKVIAYGETREQAIRRMQIALSEMVVEGIQTNIPCTAN
jgi:acetyl-CoA carboxylase biotin carboxylase subunit